jgi:hypothetical protein
MFIMCEDSYLSLRKFLRVERSCSRISCNLFIINRLSKILDLNERKILYYGLIYPLLSYGIAVWGHSSPKMGIKIHCRAKTFEIVQE